MRKGNLLKIFRFACLICIIGLGLITIVGTGGGGGGGGDSSPAPTPTPTPTPITVTGTVFHDMNGNGVQDTSSGIDENDDPVWWRAMTNMLEPVLDGVIVTYGDYSAITDDNGKYELEIPPGDYSVSIEKNNYRFHFKNDYEIMDLSNGIPVIVSEETEKNFGIGIGLLTLPYPKKNHDKATLYMYTDLSPEEDLQSRYNKDPDEYPIKDEKPGTGDMKRGLEFESPPNDEIIAAAPGIIVDTSVADDGLFLITIMHTGYEGLPQDDIPWDAPGLRTLYSHVVEITNGISIGVLVKRGQVLGYNMYDPGYFVDGHFAMDLFDHKYYDQAGRNPDTDGYSYLDTFRDTFGRQFAFKPYPTTTIYRYWMCHGSPGYWTVDNRPQYVD